MTSISDVIGHYQRSIDKSAHDEARLLHCIEKLYKLPITVEHLQQTGIGKTVNSLRKYDKEVGVAAKTLVAKWKAMVAAEEEIANDDDDDGDERKSSDDEGDTDKHNGHSYDRHSDRNESPSKRPDKSSSYANSETKERSKYKEEHSRHNSSNSSDRHSRDKSSNSGTSSKTHKEVDRHRSNGKIHGDRRRDEDSSSSSRKSRQQPPSSQDSDDQRLSDDDDEDEDEEKLIIDTEKEIERKIEQSSKQSSRSSPKSSSHHKSSKSSSSSRSDHHKHDREKEKDKKESSKKSSSSSTKSSEKSDKDKPDDRHRHKSDRKDEEKNSRSNGDHKSSSSSSTSSKSSSSKHHDKSKDTDKKSKESSSSKSSSSKSSSSNKDKEKSSSTKDSDPSSSKRKHEHTESSNSDDEQNVPKKVKTAVLEGIDSSAGTFSFEEALGIMAPPAKPTTAKSKSSKTNGSVSSTSSSSTKSTPSRSGSSSSSSSRSKTPPLLTPKAQLAPLDPKLSLELPTISNNYKPMPLNPTVMDCVFSSSILKATPPKRTMSDADALQSGIQSKTIRTKIYSGVKTGQILQVPTLFQLCIRVLQKNIDALEYTGDVPYDILKPVLELATPQQLQLFEEYNPYILVDTDELWEKHCYRRYKSQKREEMESWREMFVRCKELEAQRLSALTKNITFQQKQIAAPVRRTQLAYVDVDVKPPRNVQRKQEQYGTKGKMIATPAARVEALSKMTPTAAKIGDTRLRVAAADTRDFAQASSNNRPRKAPLMQKTLQLMRGRFKR